MSVPQLSPDKMDKSKALLEKDNMHYLPVFNRMPLAYTHGKGCTLWDADGNEYLDALAGIAVNSLGHAHPKVTESIRKQAEKLIHISNFFVSEPQVQLAEKLTKVSGLEHVFFTNSGTESFEGAVKIARKYAHSIDRGGTIISMHHSFHGRTMAAIAAGKPEMQQGFEPMPEGFFQIPFNDINAFTAVISSEIAAVVIEPVQGEGGIHLADKTYLQQLRSLCDKHNIVLIFDEIQCGMGRTGKLFAKEHYGVEPDILLLAKALGNGIPIGAILSNKKVSSAIEKGDHGTTFGGNPLACATALTVLNEINQIQFLRQVIEKGHLLKSGLETLQKEFDCIKEVRGLGLMIGVEFKYETKPLVMKLLENGVIANATAGNVLRLVPPLIISEKEIQLLIKIISKSISQIQK
jgi:acetylornithine/N-succinyldiaminopimelate aminotransferase